MPTTAGILRYYAGIVRDHRGDDPRPRTRTRASTRVREPLGVIAALIPWNSPLITLR